MKSLEIYKKYLIIIFPIIFLIFAKLGSSPDLDLWMVLFPIIISICGLTLLSPPIATALVFMSHNLIGQITMAHPGLLIQVFPAGALILTLLYVRKEEVLNEVKEWRAMRAESWGLLVILAIFMIGFFQSMFSNLNMATTGTIINLFKSSHGGSFEFYAYVFMSRWFTFILIGALCCRGTKEIKIFLLALAAFVIAQLIAVPLDSYQTALSDACFNRINSIGLQALNVNRAYLGYLIAVSSFVMLASALNEIKYKFAFLYYSLAFILLFLCVLTGSKGPVAAFAVSLLFLITRGGWKNIKKLSIFGFVFLVIMTVLPQLVGCSGGLQRIIKSSIGTTSSSISVRKDLAKSGFKKTDKINIWGSGLGASLSTTKSTYVNPVDNISVTITSSSGSHNLFLDFYVDLGFVGLVIFIIGLAILIYVFFKSLNESPESHFVTTLMGGVLLILLVYSLLATAPSMATIQALFVGVLYGVGIKSPSTSKSLS